MPDYGATVAAGDAASIEGRRFGMQWDPVAGAPTLDFGWIGEDLSGAWIAKHPQLALLDSPDLWDVWSRWRLGLRKVDDTSTEHDIIAYHVMDAADGRRQVAEARRGQG